MVNKGRIYRKSRNCFRYIQNLIKFDDEMDKEVIDFSIFGKKTLRKIQEIKNHSI